MKVPYGIADLKKIRTEGYLYVDKTMYLEELEKYTKVIYTRPRRFGKSTFTNMMMYYYDIAEKENFERLFKGLYIYDHQTPNKNNYYIMYFNFSGVKADKDLNKEETEKEFNKKVAAACRRFIQKYKLEIEFDANQSAASILTEVISEFEGLKKEHQIYIIIDEYDHFTNGMLHGNAEDFLEILGTSGFFYEVIKENCETINPPVGEFFATGVAPITLDSLTSGFNIATKVTNDEAFTAMCGLTEEEVKFAIKEAGINGELAKETFNKMKENYDGYIMNKRDGTSIYNTTLVMYYLRELSTNGRPPDDLIDENLASTGTKIKNMAGLINREENYNVLNELLVKGEVQGILKESFDLEDDFDRNDFISLLYYNGYITIKEVGVRLKFGIPNYVIEMLYANYFLKLAENHEKYKINTTEIEEAMQDLAENGEIKRLCENVKDFLFHCSVRDKEKFNEMNLKHIFSMILAFTSQYVVYAEYPAGQGFADLMIQKASNSLAKYEAIVELKYISEKNAKTANIEELKEDAKKQLDKYMKDKRLEQREYLKKYVIIFKGFENYYVEEI